MTIRRINTRGIIYKDGKIFAQQLIKNSGSDNYWCTPGGGLDEGEALVDGLHREMIEETGIVPVIGKLLFIQQFHDGTKEQLEFFFHIENASDYEIINLSQTSHGELEIERCEFINPKTENILPAFLKVLDIAAYLTSNLPVFIDNDLPI